MAGQPDMETHSGAQGQREAARRWSAVARVGQDSQEAVQAHPGHLRNHPWSDLLTSGLGSGGLGPSSVDPSPKQPCQDVEKRANHEAGAGRPFFIDPRNPKKSLIFRRQT